MGNGQFSSLSTTPLLRGAAVVLLLISVSLLASSPVLASPDGPVWSVDTEAEWDAATETLYQININAPGQLEVENMWTLLWENTTECSTTYTSWSSKMDVGTWAVDRFWHRWDVDLKGGSMFGYSYAKLESIEVEVQGISYQNRSTVFCEFDPQGKTVYMKASSVMYTAWMKNNRVYGLDYYEHERRDRKRCGLSVCPMDRQFAANHRASIAGSQRSNCIFQGSGSSEHPRQNAALLRTSRTRRDDQDR